MSDAWTRAMQARFGKSARVPKAAQKRAAARAAKRSDFKGERGRLNLRAPVEEMERLKKAAEESGRTQNDIALEALSRHLDELGF